MWAKLIGGLAAVATIVGTTIVVYDHFRRPEVNLVAYATYGPVVVPPLNAKEIETVEKLRRGDWPFDGKVSYDLIDKVRAALQHILPDIPVHPEGYLRIVVTNEGTLKAEGVSLVVPDSSTLVLKEQDKNPRETIVDASTLEIGTLLARESVDVTAFLRSDASWLDVQRIRLVHASGVGTVVFKPQEGPPHESWMWTWWGFLTLCFGLPILGLLVIAFIAAWREMLLERGHREGAKAARKEYLAMSVAAGTESDNPSTTSEGGKHDG